MNLKKLLLPLALLFTLASGVSPAQAQAKTHRVVFALTSPDEADWKLMLGNIRNLMAGLAPDFVDVEVVAYGPGISFVQKGSTAESDITALEGKHIQFVACENSLRVKHILASELVSGVHVVPSGIVEVMTRQEHGWSYIKAGR